MTYAGWQTARRYQRRPAAIRWSSGAQIQVVLNWFEELNARVPTP